MSRNIVASIKQGKEGNVACITLSKPERYHALDTTMLIHLQTLLRQFDIDPAIKAVVIQAEKSKAFCAGGDLKFIYAAQQTDALQLFFKAEYACDSLIFHYTKPLITIANGITMGGGAGLFLHARYRLITENFSFAMPESKIGFFPDAGSSYHLSRLAHKFGFYIGLTGNTISASDTIAMGLADLQVKSAEIETIIDLILQTPVDAYSKYFQPRLTKPVSKLYQQGEKIQAVFSKSSLREVLRCLSFNKDSWSDQLYKDLSHRAPISLLLTWKLYEVCQHLTFDQCIAHEYALSQYFIQQPDFFEGIRATIIDKDYAPRFQPMDVIESQDEFVEQIFIP
jgi:enoyl-CoA hydratase